MINLIRLVPTTAHQVLFVVAHIVVLINCGLNYSGIIAYVAATSSVLSILICMRWDIQILTNDEDKILKNLAIALIVIIITTPLTLLINAFSGNVFKNVIIWSACFVALHEVFVNILFVKNKIYTYSVFRCIPAIILVLSALLGMPPGLAWLSSFLSSSILLTWYFRATIVKSVSIIDKLIITETKFIPKFYAAIGSSLLPAFSALLIIIINHQFGSEYVGVWSNTIRILNSAIIFYVTAMAPFMLRKIGKQGSESGKIYIFLKFWISLVPILVVSTIIVNTYGSDILQIFLSTEISLENRDLIKIFLISLTISFIGSAQGLYQSMNKNLYYLAVINLMLICQIIFFKYTITGFSNLLTAFAILSFSSVVFILLGLSKSLKKSEL